MIKTRGSDLKFANFLITEKPSCDLKHMANSDKAFMWIVHDFSDVDPAMEKLAIRFQTVG